MSTLFFLYLIWSHTLYELSPLCLTSNESYDKDLKNGNKWAFSGRQTHSPFSGHKEDKAFYSINRHKTWPFGPSGQKVRVLGMEAWFQKSAGRRDICPPRHIPSHLRSLKRSPVLCLQSLPTQSNMTFFLTETKINRCNKLSEPQLVLLCRCPSLKFRLVWWGWRLNSQVRIFYFHSNEIPPPKKKCTHHEQSFREIYSGNTCGE